MTEFIHHYAFGKLHEARSYMASSPRPLRERIAKAFIGGLLMIRSEDLPSELRPDFERLKTLVSSEPPNSWRGSIEETLAKMHWSKVNKCGQLLVDIVDRAERFVDPKFDYWRAV
jgi:hypothetical protein